MRFKIYALFILVAIFNMQQTYSQNTDKNVTKLASEDFDNYSDEQILAYWEKAKSQGYSLDQLDAILKLKGVSSTQISKLKQRISTLRFSDNTTATSDFANNNISNLNKFGLEGKIPIKENDNAIFGYDFFTNPNISFTPNINLAAPATYQLGPGDELLIDVWGAAENSYSKQVNKQGAIKLEKIGPIYVSGLTIEKAKLKIISYLKRIYSGIGSSKNSYDKVNVDISLVGVRTVQVNIIGEVKVPGTYSLNALSSVLNALYAAGGPTKNGTFREVKVIRNGKNIGNFDIYKYLVDGSEKGNVLIRDQDKIIISPYINRISIAGSVKRPGLYELIKGETLTDLINYVSGFTSDAYKERLIVERLNGSQKEISEIIIAEEPNFILNDGDKISVNGVIDRFENRVSIGGAVYRSGNYELTDGLTLFDLIEKAAGIKENAFLERGIIYRSIDGVKQEIVPFSVKEILEKSANILLKREDEVKIFDKYNLEESKIISIDGAINNPQTIKFIDKMTIEDLIAISGGFKEGADVNVIDISRRVNDGDFKTISKIIKTSSSNTLSSNEEETLYLEPYDRVSVRYLKGFTAPKTVSIRGEVAYPGSYTIIDKDERISDLVKKAGGFSPYAYLIGATLIRKVSSESDRAQLIGLLETVKEKDSLSSINTTKSEFKIGIDLVKIMNQKKENSELDLILNEGDVLSIPSKKQTVEVRGEILLPSLIRFDESNSLRKYINKSGGFSEKAKRNKAYVIYPNGDVKSTKNFLFFKSYPKIKPGALIVVPNRKKRDKMSTQEVIAISSGLATLGLLINALIR
ncbi:MAG: protein involved in polysaccharide export with SLBB domain [Polaribacter sp.]|jgi:protein involved in polysaccharide export with SLBB domain